MRILVTAILAASLIPLSAADDWVAFGQNAAVHKAGDTVTLDYTAVHGQLGLAILQTQEGRLAGMTHLQLRAKSDVDTMLGVMLSEKKPGGDYIAIVWSPKNTWQEIDLTPADFSLNDGPKDPKDPDGRLDLDQVQGVALFDIGQFLSQAPGQEDSMLAAKPITGAHKLVWENFRIVTENAGASDKSIVIDDFHRGFLTWFSPGGAELELSKSGNPLDKPALEFRYRQQPYKFAIVMHALGQLNLHDTKEVSFDIASKYDAHVILSFEGQKTNGRAPRYNHDIELQAGQTAHMTVPFSEFTLAEDSPPDPGGHFDPGRMRSISMVDVLGTTEGAQETNTLWLADVRAK